MLAGLKLPSGRMEFQRSQMVVAPILTSYSQLGSSSCKSSLPARSCLPFSDRVRQANGVPINPVSRCVLCAPMFFSSASKRRGRNSSGTMSKCNARIRAVCVSLTRRPVGVTYSARNARTSSSRRRLQRRASSVYCKTAAVSARICKLHAKQTLAVK